MAGNARFLGVAPGFLGGVGEVLCNFVKFLWFFSGSGEIIFSCLRLDVFLRKNGKFNYRTKRAVFAGGEAFGGTSLVVVVVLVVFGGGGGGVAVVVIVVGGGCGCCGGR